MNSLRHFLTYHLAGAAISAAVLLRCTAGAATLPDHTFFPFCIDWHDAKKRSFDEQAEMLKDLGYPGVGHIWLDKVEERLKTLDAAGLRLFQITMVVEAGPGKAPYDVNRFKEVCSLMEGRKVQFCLLVNGLTPSDPSGDPHAVGILREMSEQAKNSGAQLLLYPHQGSWIERIEDSIRVAEKVDRPNVGVMFNLCHWLRVDKSREYRPLLERAMPRLWAISINGADEFDEKPGWDRYIQPLGEGSFDMGKLLKTLKEIGYKGPIGLQCYGIGGDTRDHLDRSMKAWRKLSLNLRDSAAAAALDQVLPTRGLCIAAPNPSQVDSFVHFIQNELAPRLVNTLILRVDYNYQFTSRPEMADSSGLSKADVKKLVAVCQEHGIRLIPQINMLGHQSWARSTGKLLRVYPEFDETPWVAVPEKYTWPNPDGLYCRSYCTLHPKVHEVVLPLVDEICDVFEAAAFHAGMDEVFYIGEEKCPRCGGKDKAELFASEVKRIRDHLRAKDRQLWIWGDRLLDGRTTGLGEWEGSFNDTHRAVDLIPKDVLICDWHYDRAVPTAVYFAMKGFSVVSCPWQNPASAVQQLRDMVRFRQQSTDAMKPRFQGVVQTVWSGAGSFLEDVAGHQKSAEYKLGQKTAARCFLELFGEIQNLR
jgi:sugar phosphate isomerase/epimerase